MNPAERLARQIRRVAQLRGHHFGMGTPRLQPQVPTVDGALDLACKAAGSGDPVAIEAAAQQLEQFIQ